MRARAIGLLAGATDRAIKAAVGSGLAESASVRRILVIKPCCLGDVLMATPAIRALRCHNPDATIDVLTRNWCARALENNPHIARIISYPDRITASSLRLLAVELRRSSYDLGVSLDRSPLANMLLSLARIPERVGIDSQSRGVGLTRRVVPHPDQHETDLYLDVVRLIGPSCKGREPEYFPTEAAREEAARLLPDDCAPLVVIHPGGAINPGAVLLAKRWPSDSFAELAGRLVRERGARIVLVGADSDLPTVDAVERGAGVDVLNLGGRLSFSTLAAVCERALLYVGNDSGIAHLAAAVGTPTVTIFGPTSPRRYRPLGPLAQVVAPPAAWGPADDTDLRGVKAVDPRHAITNVTVEEVYQTCVAAIVDWCGKHAL